MQINVSVNVKPFPVPTSVTTDRIGDAADTEIPLGQLNSITLAQLCQEFTDSVYKAAGATPMPTKRTRAVKPPESCAGAKSAK